MSQRSVLGPGFLLRVWGWVAGGQGEGEALAHKAAAQVSPECVPCKAREDRPCPQTSPGAQAEQVASDPLSACLGGLRPQ